MARNGRPGRIPGRKRPKANCAASPELKRLGRKSRIGLREPQDCAHHRRTPSPCDRCVEIRTSSGRRTHRSFRPTQTALLRRRRDCRHRVERPILHDLTVLPHAATVNPADEDLSYTHLSMAHDRCCATPSRLSDQPLTFEQIQRGRGCIDGNSTAARDLLRTCRSISARIEDLLLLKINGHKTLRAGVTTDAFPRPQRDLDDIFCTGDKRCTTAGDQLVAARRHSRCRRTWKCAKTPAHGVGLTSR